MHRVITTGQESPGDTFIVVAEQNAPAVAGESSAKLEIMENIRKALKWTTSVQDESIIEGLALPLPLAIQEEQIATYERHLEETAVAVPIAKNILVYPQLL